MQHTNNSIKGFVFPYQSRLIKKENINQNIIHLFIQKPFGLKFIAGQAMDISIDLPGFELEVAPFTIISSEGNHCLEFIIKVQPHKHSLTYQLSLLGPGAIIQLSQPWDTFKYRGQGIFFAAGTGIIPFVPIIEKINEKTEGFKYEHTLVYACDHQENILFEKKLKATFGNNFLKYISRSKHKEPLSQRINCSFLKRKITKNEQYFYVCGPKSFEYDIKNYLVSMGIERYRIQTGYKFGQSEPVISNIAISV
ncbi:hypothetical protein [Allomuricauda sp. F6463D]|uniref:hypothetical protein n=1 Tax=Allomuricauda sp. F6463D TaxID=2926409 RepID=UPI001FF5C7DD|nr:hypothetical protein [Muricauda sp. F6463D]MCK0159107.1 hypothetical protein [Muricauda sp. F6463D]